MSTDQNSPLGIDRLDEDRLQTVVKLLLLATGLLALWWMVTSLPGLDELVSFRGVGLGELLGAVVTLAIVGVLVFVASGVETLLRQLLGGPRKLVEDLAAAAKNVVQFVAVLTAYDGLAGVVMPTLETADLGWTYHLLFLALALVPLVALTLALYGNVDEIASLLTDRLTADRDGDATATDGDTVR